MLAWLFGTLEPVSLNVGRISLREPKAADYRQWADLRGASRAYLTPWEPQWDADELSMSAFRRRLRRNGRARRRGAALTLFIFLHDTGQLAGGISIFDIRHGVSNSARIGYWMGQAHAGKGLMSEALAAILPYCFGTLGLHRLEAACIPRNAGSRRVLEKAGFAREGMLRSYLRINGIREDHELYARLADADGENINRD